MREERRTERGEELFRGRRREGGEGEGVCNTTKGEKRIDLLRNEGGCCAPGERKRDDECRENADFASWVRDGERKKGAIEKSE